MNKLLIILFLISLLFNEACSQSFAFEENQNNDYIAVVNNEKISSKDFNRLLNAKKRKFKNEYNFDLFKPSKDDMKRIEGLNKAKIEGITASGEDFKIAWNELTKKYGNFQNLESKGRKNNFSISDIRTKLEENIILEKAFEIKTKERLLEQLINETVVLQEAKKRNIIVNEEEIAKKFSEFKSRLGREEALYSFLKENNASLEDVISEMRNQLLYQILKSQINYEKAASFERFLASKKLSSSIVVFRDKIFPPQIEETFKIPVIAKKEIIINPPIETTKPAELSQEITHPNPADIKEFEKTTNKELANILQKEQEGSEILRDEIETKIKHRLNPLAALKRKKLEEEVPLLTEEQKAKLENAIRHVDDNLNETLIVPGTPITSGSEKRKDIEELRQKIEQRRVVAN